MAIRSGRSSSSAPASGSGASGARRASSTGGISSPLPTVAASAADVINQIQEEKTMSKVKAKKQSSITRRGASIKVYIDASGPTVKAIGRLCSFMAKGHEADAGVMQRADIPAIGQPWPEQRGIRMAEIAGASAGSLGYHLMLVTDSDGSPIVLDEMVWGTYGKEIKGADSYTDGIANTDAMVKAGCELAKKVRAYDSDCYLPALCELQAVFANNRGQLP